MRYLILLGVLFLPQGAVAADGVVDVSLRINTYGRVSECRVLRSSGYAKLDARTCSLLHRTKRYEVRHYGGKAVPYEQVETYRWQVPRVREVAPPQIPETRIH
jgi:TonB family protein